MAESFRVVGACGGAVDCKQSLLLTLTCPFHAHVHRLVHTNQPITTAVRLHDVTPAILSCDLVARVKKGSPYSIAERRGPELIPVLCSQPAGYVSHKPGGRLQLLSARPAVTPATLKRAATNDAAW